LRLLLDTHVLIWALTAPNRLSAVAAEAIQDEANDVFVSMVSPWEISIKKALGNLSPPDDLEAQLADRCFELLPISMHHTRAIASLPHHHGDPFDRMLVAQAQLESLSIVTADRKINRYQVTVLPAS
jgi:PIN domain nuclease of toxin-antitoxin system